jgi:transcriptional antiterminator RfaH
MMLAHTIDPKLTRHALDLAVREWGPQPLNERLAALQSQEPEALQDDGRRWHVALCEPLRERMACAGLIGKRFKALVPEGPCWTTRGLRRTKVQVMRPLIRNYIFIRLDLTLDADRWHSVTATPGVHSFLRLDSSYAVVPEREMRRLIHISETKVACREDETLFSAGECVRIGDGPFSGLTGNVVRMDSGERITVRLDILGRDTPVTMPLAEIEKL